MSGRLVQARSVASAVALLLVAMVGAVWAAPAARADSVRAAQWYLDVWHMEEVWKSSKGAGVTVALIDSGVDATHPDLAGQVLAGPMGAGDDGAGHGTGMAGLIAGLGRGNGGQGVYGVAPSVKILPFRTYLSDNSMMPGAVEKAIRLAADSPARIINLSLGTGTAVPDMREAVAYAQRKGKLVVAAAGNTPDNSRDVPVYPAAYPGVVGVSALTRKGSMASNGVPGSWVSLSAPGADTPSACISETRYCMGTGSSGAAALTSGVAALVWSVHPDWTANQVIQRLLDTANRPDEPVPSDTFGWGSVSPRKALASTDPPGPADVNPLVGKRGDAPTTAPA
ncbi:S8 family serine peptidase, partial [Streptomyces sp. SID3343]|uniref:S8 family serine peptidase n=1 Tax=Streptomyces sp. SID3343 TaxID=2690260 RepID=UPI0013686D1B